MREIGGYTITRKVGDGAQGIVYEALSPEGATVAIKIARLPETVDPRGRWESIGRFQFEARAARSLSHPNICQVLDSGADEHNLYIVMEFLDGDTVRQLIDLAGKVEPGRAVRIIREVCGALIHAHNIGIVHRDIKPDNIVVLHTGPVKLTDFGVACVLRETGLTASGETIGTLRYMSPEQVRGEQVDPRSDIFSLGATFYEMLSGISAFGGGSPGEVIRRILEEDPPLTAEAVACQASDVLQRCLQKEPQKRFQTAQEMLGCLNALQPQGAAGTTAKLPSVASKSDLGLWRWLARLLHGRRRWVALAAAAAAVLLGVALLVLHGIRSRGHVLPPSLGLLPEGFVATYLPPSLGLLPEGYVATYLYEIADPVGDIAVAPDGTLLVIAGSGNPVQPGIYVARPGDEWNDEDAYGPPGPPFQTPGGIARREDGTVLVADTEANAVWAIHRPGDPPQLLTTNKVPSPADVVVAPTGFESAIVAPGDALVCVSSFASEDHFGLWVINHKTQKVSHLARPGELQNGLLHADFGPDGTLYAVDDDSDCSGVTILTISATGEATTLLPNFKPTTEARPFAGPLAVSPATRDVFFADGSTIYRLPPQGGDPEQYAVGDKVITALEFSPDGSSLFVDGLREGYVVKIAPRDVGGGLLIGGYHPEDLGRPGSEAFCHMMSGSSDSLLPLPIGATEVDLSPVGNAVAYVTENNPGTKPWKLVKHIWKTDLDGASTENLTEVMGAQSINCQPLWSPDGRRIAFVHCTPVEGEEPCETGLDIWVMNADGTGAHPVAEAQARTGLGSESSLNRWWSSDGDRLLYRYGGSGQVVSVKADRTDRTDTQALDIPSGNFSPDGSRICDATRIKGKRDGELGEWHQLYVADADGQNRRVVCQHFVADRAIDEHLKKCKIAPTKKTRDEVYEWIGPRRIRWSPKGDSVAFVGILPFDPTGDPFHFQQEVWMCDVSTGALTKLTENTACEDTLRWTGGTARRDGR